MATAVPPESVPEVPRPTAPTGAAQAVIRRVQGAEETAKQRLVRKHLPSWVGSGVFHVMLVVAMICADKLMAKPAPPPQSLAELTVVAQTEDKNPVDNLINPDEGIDPEIIQANDKADNLAEVNVDTLLKSPEIGAENATNNQQIDTKTLAGVGSSDAAGSAGDAGNVMSGGGGGGDGISSDGMLGRGQATRSKLVDIGGGNKASEAAVARGLIWLVKQQKPNGSWVFDGSSKGATIAATGMGLLPLLAAGQTHKSTAKDNKFKANVDAGIKFILVNQKPDGSFNFGSSTYMYDHAIVTVAICELLGMSGDKALVPYAQKAVNYIVAAQSKNGSWGYQAGKDGDTSIVGWQIQALQSAKLCKDLVVDKKAFERCRKFLDSVAVGSSKSQYGYASASATPTMTPVGLLCRYYVDGWGPNNPGMAAGVGAILKGQLPNKAYTNIYYYYYATQVMHFFEGKEWYETWNPAMRDMLISTQTPQGKKDEGSWEADKDLIGTNCGRLGTTCLTLMTLEVYYRHLPLYKRDTGGLKELERIK